MSSYFIIYRNWRSICNCNKKLGSIWSQTPCILSTHLDCSSTYLTVEYLQISVWCWQRQFRNSLQNLFLIQFHEELLSTTIFYLYFYQTIFTERLNYQPNYTHLFIFRFISIFTIWIYTTISFPTKSSENNFALFNFVLNPFINSRIWDESHYWIDENLSPVQKIRTLFIMNNSIRNILIHLFRSWKEWFITACWENWRINHSFNMKSFWTNAFRLWISTLQFWI